MLNEEKIKIMNKLAMYEQGEGKKYLPVSRYYRSDYIGLAMIKNFFLVTIGYCLILSQQSPDLRQTHSRQMPQPLRQQYIYKLSCSCYKKLFNL